MLPRNLLLYRRAAWKFGRNNVKTSPSVLISSYHSHNGVYGYVAPAKAKPRAVPEDVLKARNDNANVFRMVEAYRRLGHIQANLDPLGLKQQESLAELGTSHYGLHPHWPKHDTRRLLPGWSRTEASADEIARHLHDLYCGAIGVEFMHLESAAEREWFAREFEASAAEPLDAATRTRIATSMLVSQNFDRFVGAKFPTVKRYGGEGAESCMAFYDELFRLAGRTDTRHIFMCMAHRGRLNLLTGALNFPLAMMFAKMKGHNELPAGTQGIGDVLSHLTSVAELSSASPDRQPLTVTMLPNPSHLEAANPFAVGRTRVEQQRLSDADYRADADAPAKDRVVCLQVHGDAAVAGQGVVQETLALSQVPHFNVGGSIHLVVNNQVGYTTPAERGRSSRYCSDVAKSVAAPVLHVNGDDAEAVVRAARLAWNYRRAFRRDVFVDVQCFRKWGHNELDEPTFTNPLMYAAVRSRQSIPDRYGDLLVAEGVVTRQHLDDVLAEHTTRMAAAFKEADAAPVAAGSAAFRQVGQAQALEFGAAASTDAVSQWDTGVDADVLRWVGARSVETPDAFQLHSTLRRGHVDARLAKLRAGVGLDWSTAETLALASLLYQGHHVRLCGQDVGRGTFSQRHCMLVDQETGAMHVPLNELQCPQGQGRLEVANSPLSEEAVMAFEYGMSVGRPDLLCVWEAQFGDFFNGAQIMIDTLVASGEAKWQLQTALVLLLPHGFDGAGPEHSSCRLERFLQLTDSAEDAVDADSVNMQVANPTTPAQMFHLLRRQLVRTHRKPLVVAGPKTLLRSPDAVSTLAEMAPGTHFRPVLDDPLADAAQVRRLLFVSGKHYYALAERRRALGRNDVAVVRLEELVPFPTLALQQLAAKYPKATEAVWCQEEPRNGGAWSFVEPRFRNLVGLSLRYAGRPALAAPAVGVSAVHKVEVARLMDDTFA